MHGHMNVKKNSRIGFVNVRGTSENQPFFERLS